MDSFSDWGDSTVLCGLALLAQNLYEQAEVETIVDKYSQPVSPEVDLLLYEWDLDDRRELQSSLSCLCLLGIEVL